MDIMTERQRDVEKNISWIDPTILNQSTESNKPELTDSSSSYISQTDTGGGGGGAGTDRVRSE